MGGSERPPSPPALGHAPAEPWRASNVLRGFGGLDGPPKPPGARTRPGKAVARLGLASRLGGLGLAPRTGAPERGPPGLGGSSRPGRAAALVVMLSAWTALLEDRLELDLAADRPVGLHGLEAGHRVVVDVAVLVEAPLAVDALEVLGGGDRLAHGLALLGDVLCLLDLRRGPLDRVDDHPRALGRVERVRGRLLAVLALVGLVGLRADAAHLLERQAGERDPHVGAERRVAGGALEQLFLEESVRAHEARARRDQTDLLHLPDDHLRAGLDDAAHVDEVSARGAHLG